MATELTPEKLAEYRATARRRREQEQRELNARRKCAWASARRAATLLKQQFAASRVVLYGSLARGHFNRWSDVDIAAWSLRPEDTLRAIGAVRDLDEEIELNLTDVNTVKPGLLAAIEREGIEL